MTVAAAPDLRPRSPVSTRSRIGSAMDAHEVLPGVWLGSDMAASQVALTESSGFSHVLCVSHPGRRNLLDYPDPVEHLVLPLFDEPSADALELLPDAVAFLDGALAKEGAKVLVHCGDGLSRAPFFVAAYLMLRRAMLRSAALETVFARRGLALNLNAGFKRQLKLLEESKGDIEGARSHWGRVVASGMVLSRMDSLAVESEALREARRQQAECHTLLQAALMLQRVMREEQKATAESGVDLAEMSENRRAFERRKIELQLKQKIMAVGQLRDVIIRTLERAEARQAELVAAQADDAPQQRAVIAEAVALVLRALAVAQDVTIELCVDLSAVAPEEAAEAEAAKPGLKPRLW